MRRIKKALALSLAFMLFFSSSVFAADDTADAETKRLIELLQSEIESLTSSKNSLEDQVENLLSRIEDMESENKIPETPIIMITDPLIVEIEAGQTKTIELSIKNLTSYSARNVLTTISPASLSNGIAAKFSGNDANISSLGNKATKKVSISISIDSSTKEGNYVLNFDHKFVNNLGAEKTATSVIGIKVKNSASSTNVGLSDISASQGQIVPGSDFVLSANIKNEGSSAVKNLTLSIDGMSSDTVFLKNSTSIVDISSLSANGTQKVSIDMTSSSKAKKGSYPLALTLSYENSEGEKQTKTYTYYVNVSGIASSTDIAEVVITNISTPKNTIGVGSEFSMTLNLKNTSGFTANNIKISARPEGEGAIVPKSTSITQIPTLTAGEERQLTFTFAPTSSSRSQNYVIGFTVDYETGAENADDSPEINTFTQYQGVNVSNPEADKKDDDEVKKTSVPKIIISDYLADPIIVRAGHEFDLSMTFLNTNADKEIKNIKAYLTVDEGTEKKGSVFSPVNSSNTFYIDSIGPKGEITKTIRLYTIPDASPKTYTINVNFEYEDSENNEYKSVEMVGINVKQVTELKTSDISIEQYGMLWSPIYVNFEFYNTGKVTLSNLMITVEGNFEANQKSVYYGSFTSSSTEYYDNQIMPTEEGTQSGAIVISYEDDTGEKVEERKEFTVEVSPTPAYEPDEGMINMGEGMVWDEKLGMFVEEKNGVGAPVLIGGGVAVAVVIAAAVVIVKKKRKQGSIDLDE